MIIQTIDTIVAIYTNDLEIMLQNVPDLVIQRFGGNVGVASEDILKPIRNTR